MNYQKIYLDLIEKYADCDIEIGENHHIIPRCIGGHDLKSNIARLPPRIHFIAHQLLCKIYPSNRKLAHALNIMCVDGSKKYSRLSKRYAWIREHFIRNHPCKDPNVKKKISEALKKRYKDDPEIVKRIGEAKRGVPIRGGVTMVKKLCDCGCGTIIEYRLGNAIRKYAKGHIPKKIWTAEEREVLSKSRKNYLSNLTSEEKSAIMKKSALKWQGDPEKEKIRHEKISRTKQNKSRRLEERSI